MRTRLAVVAVLVAVVAACAPDPTTGRPPVREAAVAAFSGTVGPAPADRMAASWRPGCPVGIDDLRLLSVDHWGFDGAVRRGEVVVHEDVTDGVLGVFRALYDARFQLERVELVDVHGGSDDRSMAANNTSAFNCRPVAGSSSWSEHAYGRAIDLNPVQNPYVRGTTVQPPAGTTYLNRSVAVPGMVRPGDDVVRAFAAIGWSWGGAWRTAKDFQHFSATGR